MYKPKNFSDKIFSMRGISPKIIEEHLKLYQGYVTKCNEITNALLDLTDEDYKDSNASYSKVRELKVALSFVKAGMYLHEIYFGHLGGDGIILNDNTLLLNQINKDFGSYGAWLTDFKATGKLARGWAHLVWEAKEQRLCNVLGDAHNSYAYWGATPILSMDVYEHAYFMDYGVNRVGYIDAFFDNLDWPVVENNFLQVSTNK